MTDLAIWAGDEAGQIGQLVLSMGAAVRVAIAPDALP